MDEVIEVRVCWAENLLHVALLDRGRGFYVGEAATSDFILPGTLHAPIVTPSGELVALEGSVGWVEIPGEPRRSLADVAGNALALPPGAEARMETRHGIVLRVTAGKREAPSAGFAASFDSEALVFHAMSLLLHMGIIGSLALFMPATSSDDSESIERARISSMLHLLESADDADRPSTDRTGDGETSGQSPGSTPQGKPVERQRTLRSTIAGPPDNPDPHLARVASLREAAEFGMIGVLASGGDTSVPVVAWGRDGVLGNDPSSAQGNMWGDAVGDSFGYAGLGLSGAGECGCGSGQGVGLGSIGTIGHGSGAARALGHGRLGGTHQTRAPVVRCEPASSESCVTTVNGRLPAEVVQRIVRQSFGRFRSCYEGGLGTNPSLSGRVVVKFVIDHDGSVLTSQDGGSDLADESVRQCVVRSFANLSFPQPEGGVVTVVYPIILSPT